MLAPMVLQNFSYIFRIIFLLPSYDRLINPTAIPDYCSPVPGISSQVYVQQYMDAFGAPVINYPMPV